MQKSLMVVGVMKKKNSITIIMFPFFWFFGIFLDFVLRPMDFGCFDFCPLQLSPSLQLNPEYSPSVIVHNIIST